MAPANFEVLNTIWHPQSSFSVTSGTLKLEEDEEDLEDDEEEKDENG